MQKVDKNKIKPFESDYSYRYLFAVVRWSRSHPLSTTINQQIFFIPTKGIENDFYVKI